MSDPKPSGYFQKWFLFITLALIWGSSFILMKRGLDVYTSNQVAAIRMMMAFLFLFPMVIGHVKEIPKNKWIILIIAGLLGNGIPAFLFTKAETGLSSSIAGILNSLTTVFALVVGIMFFKMKTTPTKIVGVFLGLAGAILTVVYNAKSGFEGNYYFSIYIIVACICYALNVNIIKTYLGPINSVQLSGFALFGVGPITAIYLFSTDFVQRLSSGSNAVISFLYVCVLGIFGTGVSQIMFNKLLKTSTVLFASSITYFIPIVAILWGLLDHESFGWIQGLGFLTVLAGVYLINTRKT
ncbi:MAG TPA: DMT family transporter [Bacteroidia bacterium]|jgi:drug/metabolite transporter (DMT)-like permease|nr:DMT family transporter [Bacteroidia bacterium]